MQKYSSMKIHEISTIFRVLNTHHVAWSPHGEMLVAASFSNERDVGDVDITRHYEMRESWWLNGMCLWDLCRILWDLCKMFKGFYGI